VDALPQVVAVELDPPLSKLEDWDASSHVQSRGTLLGTSMGVDGPLEAIKGKAADGIAPIEEDFRPHVKLHESGASHLVSEGENHSPIRHCTYLLSRRPQSYTISQPATQRNAGHLSYHDTDVEVPPQIPPLPTGTIELPNCTLPRRT
jgi:hypothetical protein